MMKCTPLGPPRPDNPVRAMKVMYRDDCFCVHLEDGRVMCVPVAWFITLHDATDKQIGAGKISRDGQFVVWKKLNERLSVQELMSPSALYRRQEDLERA